MMVRWRQRSPLCTISRRFLNLLRIWNIILKALSNNYKVGKAIKKQLCCFPQCRKFFSNSKLQSKFLIVCHLRKGFNSKSFHKSFSSLLNGPIHVICDLKRVQIQGGISRSDKSWKHSFMPALMLMRCSVKKASVSLDGHSSQFFMAWKLTEVFSANILLGKGQFHNETRDSGLGFEEVGFIILQLEVQFELY